MIGNACFGQGSDMIILQRAKELSNQNNVRQGVPPPAAPATPAATPVAAPAPQLHGPAKLQADLFAIKNSAQATPARQQLIASDLTSMAQGTVKPSPASLNKLAADLTAACGEKALPLASCSRLAQNLNAVLSGSHFPATQMQAIVDDVQAIFQANGLARNRAVAIADNVKAISTEIHK
jgi:hypothetical protein